MLPAERGQMGEQRVGHHVAEATHDIQRAAEIDGVPQHDGRRDQGEAAGAVLLGLGRTVVQPPEAMEAYGAAQRVSDPRARRRRRGFRAFDADKEAAAESSGRREEGQPTAAPR